MTDLFQEPDDATPLEPEERRALRQTWITHRNDLNEAEQENILQGANWARGNRRLKLTDMLTDDFMRTLHLRMFGEVWQWAGAYRRTERNIGIEAYRIPFEVPNLLGDVRYWVEHGTYPPDEVAVRLHHRLVAIHPFPNGNGRHARLVADLVIENFGGEPFNWGDGNIADIGRLRAEYIKALKAADNHDIAPLMAFAKS
ncbi:MAG TPA: mobile mystery protein B [Dongiaceae bacterium]